VEKISSGSEWFRATGDHTRPGIAVLAAVDRGMCRCRFILACVLCDLAFSKAVPARRMAGLWLAAIVMILAGPSVHMTMGLRVAPRRNGGRFRIPYREGGLPCRGHGLNRLTLNPRAVLA